MVEYIAFCNHWLKLDKSGDGEMQLPEIHYNKLLHGQEYLTPKISGHFL
jgi:hypothetical protein